MYWNFLELCPSLLFSLIELCLITSNPYCKLFAQNLQPKCMIPWHAEEAAIPFDKLGRGNRVTIPFA